MSPHPQFSIVIPAYDEETRLPKTVRRTLRWCDTHLPAYELLIVDDGSRDGTLGLARAIAADEPRVRVIACPRRGKGAAVRTGMLQARGDVVLFMDADGSTPLDEIAALRAAIAAGGDVAIGSRMTGRHDGAGPRVVTSPRRQLIGRAFAIAANALVIGGIADTQCGFKMFRREAVAPIFSRQQLDGFAFDVEILFIARRLGLTIREVPVSWEALPGSKIRVARDAPAMLRDLLRIRWRHRRLQGDAAVPPAPRTR